MSEWGHVAPVARRFTDDRGSPKAVIRNVAISEGRFDL